MGDGKEYKYREVVQKPISPAYAEILEKTKTISLKYQNYIVKEEAASISLVHQNDIVKEAIPSTSTENK